MLTITSLDLLICLDNACTKLSTQRPSLSPAVEGRGKGAERDITPIEEQADRAKWTSDDSSRDTNKRKWCILYIHMFKERTDVHSI